MVKIKRSKPPHPSRIGEDGNPKDKFPGRPALYDPNYPKLAYIACKNMGADNKILAEIFEVNVDTINKWMGKYSAFNDSIRKGKDEFDCEKVETRLLDRALGFEYTEKEFDRVVVRDSKGKPTGETKLVLTKEKVKVLPPDVQAMMFYLRNRNRERWMVDKDAEKIPQHLHLHAHLETSKLTDAQLEALDELIDNNDTTVDAEYTEIPQITYDKKTTEEPTDTECN